MNYARNLSLSFAVLLSTGIGLAQEKTVVTTQETSSKTSDGGKVVASTTTYETRLDAAYRAAGLADAEVARVKALDLKAREARRAGDVAKVKEYYGEQVRLVKPEQQQLVYRYFQQNPYPATYTVPAYDRTTWEEYYTPSASIHTPILGASIGGGAGVQVTTPIGGIGIGAPAGTLPSSTNVVEHTETVPASTTVVVPAQQ